MVCELALDILIVIDELTFKGEGSRYDDDGHKVRVKLQQVYDKFGYDVDSIPICMTELRKGKLITAYEFGKGGKEGFFCTQTGHGVAGYHRRRFAGKS